MQWCGTPPRSLDRARETRHGRDGDQSGALPAHARNTCLPQGARRRGEAWRASVTCDVRGTYEVLHYLYPGVRACLQAALSVVLLEDCAGSEALAAPRQVHINL